MSALNGEMVVCDQGEGGPLELRIFGDEFYARHETLDGFTVIYDVERGRYCYAALAAGRFVSTGVAPHKAVPAGLRRHLKEKPAVRNERFERRYAHLRPREIETGSNETRTFGPDGGLLEGRKLFAGNVRGLTLIVDFDDVRTNIEPGEVEGMMNGDSFNTNGNYCSVKKYFQIMSSNKLHYSNEVVGPIRLSKRRSHYINQLLFAEALEIAVSDFGVDLSRFDSRAEGIVDAVNLLYAGESQYSGELWPHNAARRIRHGDMTTHYYQLTGLGLEKVDLRIGTICHENGHLLCRFPDIYDYGKRDGDHEKSQGMGRYCLMSSGNHLDERRTPSPICSYLRYLAGWTNDVVDLSVPGVYEARHGDYGTVMRYPTEKPNEYFIIENRSGLELDRHLPSAGLAVYHCDTLGSNEWQEGTRNNHYQCGLLQADGHLDLENNRNAGDFGDLFAQATGVVLSHDTIPSSRAWDDTDSGLVVADVSEPGEVITFRVGSSVPSTRVSAEAAPNLIIPDNRPQGVSSALSVDRAGRVESLAVEVFIIHSWIGDLRVTLSAPDGTEVVLHDREGRNGDDIRSTWRSAEDARLAPLIGTAMRGQWQLRAVDLASADVGRLVSWSLDIDFEETGGVVERDVEPGLQIPDNSWAGISSAIDIDVDAEVRNISVGVDIAHTYVGDLQVELRSPSGRTVRLHDKEGRWNDDIVRSYDPDSTPELGAMLGQATRGQWSLDVRDLASQDVGTLRKWSLRLSY